MQGLVFFDGWCHVKQRKDGDYVCTFKEGASASSVQAAFEALKDHRNAQIASREVADPRKLGETS